VWAFLGVKGREANVDVINLVLAVLFGDRPVHEVEVEVIEIKLLKGVLQRERDIRGSVTG